MKRVILSIALTASIAVLSAPSAWGQDSKQKDYRAAVKMYDLGLYGQAKAAFESLNAPESEMVADGYALLCSIKLRTPGYETQFEQYLDTYPYSTLNPQIRYNYALNLFEDGDFERAGSYFGTVSPKQLEKSQASEYYFKYAYSEYERGRKGKAIELYKKVDELNSSDYAAPARYALGYINYENRKFEESIKWFEKSSKDSRFSAMASYYVLDCKYMLKEYEYVTENGPKELDKVPTECRPHLARQISESFLILGDAESARKYFNNIDAPETRSDYFFAGSLMYAVSDWECAVENYSAMEERTDSIGQIANYHLGYSYIQLKNKVAAMRSFKDASTVSFDEAITEDAFFNYAKLAFDLNNDPSAFMSYVATYPSKANNDRIYGYMAVASLRSKDYAAAVEAFDKIDDLDENMRGNYMKTNYLRASQLVADGSYRNAIPCLKSAAYYADRSGQFWQLSRFWLGESYFRSGDYANAKTIFTDLYNKSALDGQTEGDLISFSLGYCYFKDGDYDNAIKWFDNYLSSGDEAYRKGARLRIADSWFMKKKYSTAVSVYERVVSEYTNVNDIYPYYQAGVCYGLLGSQSKKISALSPVKEASPESRFYPEAMYELGRAYFATNKIQDAEVCFQTLLEETSDSTYMAKSLIELGMIARNKKDYESALSCFKAVVETMPLTEYADDALASIETIYQAQANPQGYLEYLASIGRSGMKTEAEKEAMIFNAAEQIYLSEDYEKALASLQNYVKAYPSGSKLDKAYYYMADSYSKLGQKETACDYFAKVVDLGTGSYQENALVQYASLSYSLQKYEDSYNAYVKLLDYAQFDDNKYRARLGKMWAAYKGRMFDKAIAAADEVQTDARSDGDTRREAQWIVAKSYMSTSQRDEALAVFEALAQNPKTEEGAEAQYILAQDSYDRGDFEKTETLVYDFADSGTPQQYWLARAFIVLGDSFLERGDGQQALATYNSILEGYKPAGDDDDIFEKVNIRINRLQGK